MENKRTNSRFTDLHREILKNNRYTATVTESTVRFTAEFRRIFWDEYSQGKLKCAQIFEKYGYAPEILGYNRMRGLACSVKSEFCADKRKTPEKIMMGICADESITASKTALIKELYHKVKYLESEIEYLGKSYAAQDYGKIGGALTNAPSVIFEIIHSAVNQSEVSLSVSELCRMAGVSRGGYYAWLGRSAVREKCEQTDRRDFDLILEAYKLRGYAKGARSLCMTLLHRDPPVVMNLKKIRRLMAKYKLVCPIRKANPYRRLPKAIDSSNIADNLVQRKFEEYGPRVILLTDITYLPYSGGFAYLSTIIDAFTKQVLSYAVSDSLEVDFVLETVTKLIENHGVSLEASTVVHSDQGLHYTSCKFIEILRDKNLRQSMSRRGNYWDNAPIESFFGNMKDHIGEELKKCVDLPEVKLIVDDYIDYHNNERYQWELAKLSPNEYYEFVTTGQYPIKLTTSPAVHGAPIKNASLCIS